MSIPLTPPGTPYGQAIKARDRLLCTIGRMVADGRGYAKQAAGNVAAWLRQHGADCFTARIHPDHEASIRVAKHLGMTATDVIIDGEVHWEG